MIALLAALIFVSRGLSFDILHPAGEIARKQRDLLVFASALSLIVVVPVFMLTAYIGIKYRATNKKADYRPDWSGSRKLELVWWLIPLALISVLSVVTWRSSHELDPYKKIHTDKKPLTVQVIAYDWKWLFIYPEQRVASVNELHLPVGRPVSFEITSSGPMNTFWIPKLGGQVYAMSGMTSQLHLMADEPGVFKGRSANISGDGFADMEFDAVATSENGFTAWVQSAQSGTAILDRTAVEVLAKPSVEKERRQYAGISEDVFHELVDSFMTYGVIDEHAEEER
jgi:cytochrome o ubiquinol oxidase subunit 2